MLASTACPGVVVALSLVAGSASPQPPAANTIAAPGILLTYEDGVPDAYRGAVADVVQVAKDTFDGLFPDLAKEEIRVEVISSGDYYESAVTDRTATIYVYVGPKGLGEFFRADAGPVGILCQAVAELHNPGRIPGFDRYVAHRYLAPSVAEGLGPDVLPRARLQPGVDDVTGMLGLMADPLYALDHPDFAAATALGELDREVGLEGLRRLLAAVPGQDDPLAALRNAAREENSALGDAFDLYDQASTLEPDQDGSCLIASFEGDENIIRASRPTLSAAGDLVVMISNQFELSQSDEWATHGDLSLKLQAEQTAEYMSLFIQSPDWRFKDWSPFAKLEVDLKIDADTAQSAHVIILDDIGRRHGRARLFGTSLRPGEHRHVSCDLAAPNLAGKIAPFATYFDGRLREREIAVLAITIHQATGPFTLYVDNLRLTPRPGAWPEAEAPEGLADGPPDREAISGEELAQTGALLRRALALKRQGQLQDAEGLLREAIELAPQDAEPHRVLAWTLVEMGKDTEATGEFRRAIELTEDPAVKREAEAALKRLDQ
ncbi:MAG TPA: tetratricopeptide repeat protein [Armatimonadota bacterium]|nr:tetratricopeptide repeat protein [Armatimonadota bacterium]